MAAKTFYFKDAVPTGATLHRSLQDGGSAPTAATTTTGWVAATRAAADSCIQTGGTEYSRTGGNWGTTLQPSAAPSQTIGDCWRSENALTGEFANTDWTFNFGFRSVTAAYTGRLKLAVRVWRSANANGTSAVELTGGRVVSAATTANLSTTADTTLSWTWTPGAVKALNNEYLFINVGIEITSAGSGTTQDFDFRVGSAYTVVTPNFYQVLTQSSRFDDSNSVSFTHTLTPGVVALTQSSLYSNSNTLSYTHTLTQGGADQTLTQSSVFSDADVLGNTHTLSATVALTQSSIFTNSNNLAYAHTLAATNSLTQSSLFSDSDTLTYGHSLSASIDLTQSSRFDNPNALAYGHTLTQPAGAQSLTQTSLFEDADALAFSHVLTPGEVILTQTAIFESGNDLAYSHTLTPGEVNLAQTSIFTDTPGYFSHSLQSEIVISPSWWENANVFYGHSLTSGGVNLTASLYSNSSRFFNHTVYDPSQITTKVYVELITGQVFILA